MNGSSKLVLPEIIPIEIGMSGVMTLKNIKRLELSLWMWNSQTGLVLLNDEMCTDLLARLGILWLVNIIGTVSFLLNLI